MNINEANQLRRTLLHYKDKAIDGMVVQDVVVVPESEIEKVKFMKAFQLNERYDFVNLDFDVSIILSGNVNQTFVSLDKFKAMLLSAGIRD